MKKTCWKLVCVLMALCMLCGCSFVQRDMSRVVVATVGDVNIYYPEYEALLRQTLIDNGVDAENPEEEGTVALLKDMVIDALVDEEIQKLKAEELYISSPADEEQAQLELQAWKESIIAQYLPNYADMSEEEALQRATEDMEGYCLEYGLDDQTWLDVFVSDIVYTRLFQYITMDIAVSEDEIQAEYDLRVENAKAEYAENMGAFSVDYESGKSLYYVPENVFFFTRILIPFDYSITDELSNLRQTEGDEAMWDYCNQQLEILRPEANKILDKVTDDAAYENLVDEYLPSDPILSIEGARETGLIMYENCQNYWAGLAESVMKALGDQPDGTISGLVSSVEGYSICKRVSTLPAGPIDLDEVRAEIQQDLLGKKQSEFFDAQMETWRQEIGVTVFEEEL